MGCKVFFSYRHVDREAVQPLILALARLKVDVWVDVNRISDTQSISQQICENLAEAGLFVAWYSNAYPASEACRWELTAAFIAAQAQGTPHSYLMVVNPESRTDHIYPTILRDANCLDAQSIAQTAARIAECTRLARKPFGDVSIKRPLWFGQQWTGFNRFVGRFAEMWTLHSGLFASGLAAIMGPGGGDTVQVQGLAGIGKSLLAIEYAIRFSAAYPGGVFWLSAAGSGCDWKQCRDDRLANLALELGISSENPGAILGEVKQRLLKSEPYLWIVDDLPSDSSVEALNAWMAPTPNGRTLITSRGTKLSGNGLVLRLGLLSREEAFKLLTSQRSPMSEEETSKAWKIVDALGCHSLALDVASSTIIIEGYYGFIDLLSNPSRDVLAFANELVGELPTGHEVNIAVTLLDSIKKLNWEGLLALQLASILAPAPIPVWLIKDAFAVIYGEGAGWHGSTGIMNVLHESLADGPLAAADRAITVHVLVTRTVRYHAQATENIISAAIKVLGEAVPKTGDVSKHESARPWVVHARYLTTKCSGSNGLKMLRGLAAFDRARGEYRAAVETRQRILAIVTNAQGREHPDTLHALKSLAQDSFFAGMYELSRQAIDAAIPLCKKAITDNPDLLFLLGIKQHLLRVAGNYEEALGIARHILSVQQRALGPAAPETLTAMNNVALIMLAQKQVEQAEFLFQIVVDGRQRSLGMEHPSTISAMSNLAAAKFARGQFAKALQLDVLCVQFRCGKYGAEHPESLTSMNNMATALRSLGKATEARDLYKQTLDIRLRVLGHEHPDTLTSMQNLACVLHEQNDLTRALALSQRVLEARRNTLGNDHPDTLHSMHCIANVMIDRGDLSDAQKLLQQVFEVQSMVLDSEDQTLLRSRYSLAFVAQRLGNIKEPKKIFQQICEAQRRTLGEEHIDTLESKNCIAGLLWEQGDRSGAGKLYREVLEARLRVHGAEHIKTLQSMKNVAAAMWQEGDQDGARSLITEAVQIARASLGEAHPNTLLYSKYLASYNSGKQ